jgi:hypothetical protein
VIVAHFTGNDVSSALLVVGVAAAWSGLRRLRSGTPAGHARRTAAAGVVAIAVSVVLGFQHPR